MHPLKKFNTFITRIWAIGASATLALFSKCRATKPVSEIGATLRKTGTASWLKSASNTTSSFLQNLVKHLVNLRISATMKVAMMTRTRKTRTMMVRMHSFSSRKTKLRLDSSFTKTCSSTHRELKSEFFSTSRRLTLLSSTSQLWRVAGLRKCLSMKTTWWLQLVLLILAFERMN